MKPSEKDIEAAKAYILRRLAAENSMVYNLEILMKQAAERIVAICYAANVSPLHFDYNALPMRSQMQIDEVIAWLQEKITGCFEELATAADEDSRTWLLPLIMGKRHGMTFNERLSDYLDKYKAELLLLIGAGLWLKLKQSAVAKSIADNLRHPYRNQMLAEGIEAPITYGRGRTNSMFTAIGGLTRFGVSEGWMQALYHQARLDGVDSWYVMRGSSYPCDLCDSMVGEHPDGEDLPPYHSHCCCIAVPFKKPKTSE